MFKKLLEFIKNRREVNNTLQKSIMQIQYDRLRDKAIEYCTIFDAINGGIELPPSHKIDCILPDMVRTKADLQAYTENFPYKELAKRLIDSYNF